MHQRQHLCKIFIDFDIFGKNLANQNNILHFSTGIQNLN